MSTNIQSSTDSTPDRFGKPAEETQIIPVRLATREITAAIVWTFAADVLIFRIGTYLSLAMFLVIAPIIYRYAANSRPHRRSLLVCAGLSALVALRLVWQGSPLAIFSAVVLLIALSMAASGVVPFVLEGLLWFGKSFVTGANRLSRYRFTNTAIHSVRRHNQLAAILLPVGAVITFGGIFVMANPDLVSWVGTQFQTGWNFAFDWIQGLSVWEAPFCVAALLVGIGLIRPLRPWLQIGSKETNESALAPAESNLYSAYRNTLIAVTGLFAVYLCFEFWTLWRRDFPEGFYYAGYAHQGAAWLTIALALATVSLSLIFGRSLLSDPRLPNVRRWAWIWSGENLLLALAVYNRLLIYIGYNGMTQMRMVGLFGITAVVIGFALVVYKIAKTRNFWWLLRSQMMALTIVIIVYSATPVDYIAHRYNAARVNDGYLAPSVMVAVKPISDEGLISTFALLDHPDAIIRDGVRARLAQRQTELVAAHSSHWSDYQASTRTLAKWLAAHPHIAKSFETFTERQTAITRFRQYAMQWY
ncbi:DUF4173 domain-containing protein [Rhodopirellula sp. JC740]|uniref:DUF4173 domain-containing protein n=1 Tax=Rhodopirellula halodulae TaxID=2894198 RepID=A0ABS8NAQ3_9BACT|nr:DUF4153 domain-containing protein [Rhodopirellula sp. JC740]MCC9640651.1 DUF4173 domain-containing protein [Rhodopirellula sp. JC740]